MKTINKIIIIILLITTFSCQDVVDVDLETSKERLVIEALIQWENGTAGNEQTIKLTKTSSFYNNEIIYAVGASVKVKNTNTLEEFIFTETINGIYQTSNFISVLNDTYELTIRYQNEDYKATSTLFQAPEIVEITQSLEGGFTDEDPEVNIFFQDFIDQEDYYRIIVKQIRPSTSETINHDFFTYDARFEENNIISGFYEGAFEVNDEFEIIIYKISERFYNFLEVLETQSGSTFGPFASPPVNVKGNVTNISSSDNYPYGYFSSNQINKVFFVFE
ncbi:MAG: DUF4249 domain-containing protein [Flavobacteriaceae bacterium]|nr:DUF4249 domain-containing protein [Flavobacteriaceae bacterium]